MTTLVTILYIVKSLSCIYIYTLTNGDLMYIITTKRKKVYTTDVLTREDYDLANAKKIVIISVFGDYPVQYRDNSWWGVDPWEGKR